MCINFADLRCMLRQTAAKAGTRPLPDVFPNDNYGTQLIAKDPGISVRCSQVLDVERDQRSSSDAALRYFNHSKSYYMSLTCLESLDASGNAMRLESAFKGTDVTVIFALEGFKPAYRLPATTKKFQYYDLY
ncbi:unnamed protein product [Phytophthora fragariaefolia]|uniref:Unnamed protein product n=1 Tax=Phytophthora fragariaefolia TaxID=1490495 RepID=A0A9W7CFV9_9STRA|nr:unnamed protein product [Phytophthora fragariaefolia]